ncbi:MAG: hypothetical protein M3N51_10350 [Actinomycetota bacterium]|nr:hypothetical protein [Actinomycetota bacterium]
MPDIFGLDRIFVELVLALGAALVLGNGWALWQHLRGRRPAGASGGLRRGRVAFLLVVGLVMTAWAALTLLLPG